MKLLVTLSAVAALTAGGLATAQASTNQVSRIFT